MNSLFNEFKTSSLYFIASSGEILLNKNLENTSNLSSSIASPLGQNSLSFLNKKELEYVRKEEEAFSSVFDPETSEFYKSFVKNIGQVSEFFFGNINSLYKFDRVLLSHWRVGGTFCL